MIWMGSIGDMSPYEQLRAVLPTTCQVIHLVPGDYKSTHCINNNEIWVKHTCLMSTNMTIVTELSKSDEVNLDIMKTRL